MSLRLAASDEQLRESFFALRTPQDVAGLLDVDYKRLNYHLYVSDASSRYARFQIPKASGGVREISAPVTALKIIQRKLAGVLNSAYQPKPTVYGFVMDRNIVGNAARHIRQRWVLNADLRDFFPSINFGRVRGIFMAWPYKLPATVATVLAQICCFDNQLPQGAPTSPIVSNMICAKMDSQLRRLARKNRCIYTRYADDLTFSTFLPMFPPALAAMGPSGQVAIGEELERIINENGFEVNEKKVTLRGRNRRQEVTGLTTNRFPNVRRTYVRQIRAMLHAWEKFGLDGAEKEFLSKYDKKHRGPYKDPPSFKRVVKGKLDFLRMVRGGNNPVYLGLLHWYARLDPEYVLREQNHVQGEATTSIPWIATEGKTDWKHLKAAFSKLRALGRFGSLNLEFDEYEEDRGGDQLLAMVRYNAKTPNTRPRVFIFDRDQPQKLREFSDPDGALPYKRWGNCVFSFPIPVPDHRESTPNISIEFYYTDEEIKRTDQNGRRLFMNTEFDRESCGHRTDQLYCTQQKKVQAPGVLIIDDDVFDMEHNKVALSKSAFADNVLNRVSGFDDFDVSQFAKIFDVVSAIAAAAATNPRS